MEASHDPECRRVSKTTINSLEYLYDGERITCFGHSFIEICLGDDNRNKPIQFWKAQLAFRGFSPRESDIEALKQRLVNSNTDEPDTVVEQGIQKMMRAFRKKDRENKEPVHQAQQARHEEEGKDSDQDLITLKKCDDDADNTDEELDDDELDDDELGNDELDDERVYLGMWATTGHWELKCKTISSNYGRSEPYTLDIFSVVCTQGFQVFGRFNLGEFKGIIRFARGGNSADRNEYILDQEYDAWTADMDSTRIYRWRGKDRRDIIQLGSDSYAYTMTFSRAGTRVNGV